MHSMCYRAREDRREGLSEGRPNGSRESLSRRSAGLLFLFRCLGVILGLVPCMAPALAQPANVTITAFASKSAITPSDQFAIAVVFDHAPGWHVHTNAPVVPKGWDFLPFPTEIVVAPAPGLTLGPTQWPSSHEILADLAGTGKPAKYAVFEGRAIAYLPFVLDANATLGVRTISIEVTSQACNDRVCAFQTTDTLVVEIEVVAPGLSGPALVNTSDFAGLDLAAFDAIRAGAASGRSTLSQGPRAKPVEFRVFNWTFSVDPSGSVGLMLMVLLAILGGFVLNLTPCVLPVIPIKIMGLAAVAGNPRRMLALGLIMCAGTITFWMAIGIAIASLSSFKAISQLFQTPFFALAVGAFILVMAVGMMGWFTIGLPQAVYAVDPKRESPAGSFMFGVLTAVLSTPCTAPFMASASAWAATQRPAITLLVFTAIGVGMAVPYAILSAFPKLVDRIPRTGPASELVKQVMGLLMIAVAVFFLGTGLDPLLRSATQPPIRFHWWLSAVLVACAMGWLLFRAWRLTSSKGWRFAWVLIAGTSTLTAGGVARSVTDRGPIPWLAYTPESFRASVNAGRVVVLDFTAEWCLNCKVLEGTVLHKPEIVKLLNGPGVVAMRVDLTGKNPDGAEKLKELRWVGIPLLAIYGPGSVEPQTFDTYTPAVVSEAIARARGPRFGSLGG